MIKFLDTEFKLLSEIERKTLLEAKAKEKGQNRIPLDKFLQIINKHWHLLQMHWNLRIEFEKESIIAYRQNKNLGDLIGSKKVSDGNALCKNNSKKRLYCRPCLEEIIFVAKRFWRQIPSHVTELVKRPKFFIN